MKILGWMLVVASLPVSGFGQGECYRTAREAATQAGVRDGEGFRLEGVTADRVGGGNWARVVACTHPERPGRVVKVKCEGEGEALRPGSHVRAEVRPKALVTTGATVRVVRVEAMSRLEMAGVAQGEGAVGERVRVQLASEGEARFVSGVVQSDGSVAMDGGL